MKKHCFSKVSVAIAALVLVMALSSCMHYYKVANTSVEHLKQFNTDTSLKTYRYFILRAGNNAYHMDNIAISQDGKTITCLLDSLDEAHTLHLSNGIKGKMRYKKHQPQAVVIYELHIYTANDNSAVVGSNYTLTADKIQKIELLEKDKARTTTSFVLGGLGYALVILIVGFSIAVAVSPWHT